jgi:hypothetical protein
MKIATYTIGAICDNCPFKGQVVITRSKPVSQQACPNCGCRRLRLFERILPWHAR